MALIYGCPIFLKNRLCDEFAVSVEDGRIVSIIPTRDITKGADDIVLDGGFLAPGFIDLQVNGGGGVLLNDEPTVAGVRAIAEAHRSFGTTGVFPTLISDTPSVIAQAIRAVDGAIEAGVPGVLGIHIEGPFLNLEKKGVHDASKFLELDDEFIALLSSLKHGKMLVTLAPEKAKPGQIKRLVERGVVVAAGHTNATYETIRAAEDEGLTGFTHLYNAMSQLVSRAPGVVGAALDSESSWASLIADTYHIHEGAFRIAIKCKTPQKSVLVTDAMPSVGAPPNERNFNLFGEFVTETDGKLTIDGGTLAGSALDMMSAVENAVSKIGVTLEDALIMATQAPAAAMGLQEDTGSIEPGKRANFVHFSDSFDVLNTWIDGRPAH